MRKRKQEPQKFVGMFDSITGNISIIRQRPPESPESARRADESNPAPDADLAKRRKATGGNQRQTGN
jgi:hypothetical protein